MESVGMTRMQDENNGEMLTSPSGRMSRKRKMEERDENSLGEPEDFEWENSKENVMPLKRGRVVVDLNRALRTQESFQGKARVDQEAKEMEARVSEYAGSDPLAMWVQYIKWLEANMPEDTRKKFAALEKCTRELKSHAEYKNDIRYIRLWIQYADLVSNPKDIFKFLYVNKIGEHISLFYVGWAMVLESMGNYAQAHKVYLKATQKKAHPEDLLDRKYKEFQRRMSRHWLKVRTSDDNDASIDGNHRFALEDITTDGAEIQRLGNSDNFRRYMQTQAEKMQRTNAHKPVFTVYEDPDGVEADAFAMGTDWKRLDTVKHQNKENDTAPTRWNDAPLHAQNSDSTQISLRPTARPPAEALQVFVDPEFASSRATVVERGHSLTLRQRLDGASTEEEKLLQQPLKNFTAETKADVSKPPRGMKTDKTTKEKYAFHPEALKTKSGEELCFEEVRARQFFAKMSKARAVQSSGTSNRFLVQQPTQVAASYQSLTRSPEARMSLGMEPTEKPSQVAVAGRKELLGAPKAVTTLTHAAQDDVTINTRLAMEDVNSMFCSPSRESKDPVIPASVWEVPEPVERKLHFSIFDDSVDSIAVNPNDISLRNENAEQVKKNPFQVFTEELPTPKPQTSFQVFSDDADSKPTTAPRTASKMSARKPLTSREDLARRSRLTNKDMILKIQTDDASADDGQSLKAKIAAHQVQTEPMRERDQVRGSKIAPVLEQREALRPQVSCDPYSPATRRQMMKSASVVAFAAARPDLIHRHLSKAPSLWTSNEQRRRLKKPIVFNLDKNIIVQTVGFLGSGAFAQVFSVKVEGIDPAPQTMALKVEKAVENLLWETYITEKLRKSMRLGTSTNGPIPRFGRLDVFKNGAFLLMEKAPAGTMHDLLNVYKKDRKSFPETLAIHYVIQMIYAVESIHATRILHGDIKPDNWVLVQLSSTTISSSNCEARRGTAASTGGLRLIDFGRSIDMDFFPSGTTFHGDCHVKGFQTVEMLTKRPWTTQIDTFGICATAHCLLFGDYMEVTKTYLPDGSSRWKPTQAFKRYWQVGMWKDFFDSFLNVRSCDKQPSLAATRRRFERFFEESPHRQEELRELLAAQDRMLAKPKV